MRDRIAATLNLFPEVTWDRWAGDMCDRCLIFGWVAREDGRSDYAQLIFEAGEVCSISTSSARYSHEFACRLGGTTDHKDCNRVEHDFPNVRALKLSTFNLQPSTLP